MQDSRGFAGTPSDDFTRHFLAQALMLVVIMQLGRLKACFDVLVRMAKKGREFKVRLGQATGFQNNKLKRAGLEALAANRRR